MYKYLITCAIGVLYFTSCQYPADSSKLPAPQRFLVIDAALTEQYGKVKVSWTFSDVTPQGAYITPAPPHSTVYVKDGQGNIHNFTADGTIDSTFHGKVGETYQLFVEADGENYESDPETLRFCPEIDSVRPNYTRESFRSPEDLYYDGFDVYVYCKDQPGVENYYQWDWVHYQRTTACNRVTINGTLYYLPCSPYDCWGVYRNKQVIVQSDKLRDGNAFAQKASRVPFSQPPLRYYLRVEQRSITPSVFGYLKSQETQTQNVGSIFDIPAQTVFSPNVHNVNNPDEKILGVFSVFSTRYKIISINMLQHIPGANLKVRTDLTPKIPDPLAQAPCIESDTRTLIKPEMWVE